jgi:hypothetical protein
MRAEKIRFKWQKKQSPHDDRCFVLVPKYCFDVGAVASFAAMCRTCVHFGSLSPVLKKKSQKQLIYLLRRRCLSNRPMTYRKAAEDA